MRHAGGTAPVSYTHIVDDGYSGTNYDRPGFQSMLVEIEAGRVGIVITKDPVSYTHLDVYKRQSLH